MQTTTRRGFLARSAGLAAAFALPAVFPGKVRGASERIVMGIIGCGGQGTGDMNALKGTGTAVYAAACDVYTANRERARSMNGSGCAGYNDFRDLLDRKDIDAVNIGTPDHWHALGSIMACQAGKDVYVEKPMCHNLWEGAKMVEAARMEIEPLLESGFQDIVVSLKSHDPAMTIAANVLFAENFDLPLHIGVTEAGLPDVGAVRSAVGIGSLLISGIGDTIRVSLTGDPVEEVVVGKRILRACGLLKRGVELVSCPTCGRCRVDLIGVANEISRRLPQIEKYIQVAIMGCEVNGPGEAKMADVGIAGGNGYFLLFKKGKVIEKVPQEAVVERLLVEIEELAAVSDD